jgi:hypothetical protein
LNQIQGVAAANTDIEANCNVGDLERINATTVNRE